MIDGWADRSCVPQPPRVVPRWFFMRRMRGLVFTAIMLFSLGLFFGIGLPVFFYFLGEQVSPLVDLALDENHASATAILIDKRPVKHMHLNSCHPWRIAFQFTSADGQPVDAVGYTFDKLFDDKAVGDSISVEYDPANPSSARPVGGSVAIFPPWAYLLALALLGPELVVGLLLTFVAVHRARGERILLTHGVGAEAEVVRVKRLRHISFGSKNPYDIHYQFRDHRRMVVMGRGRTYHYAWAKGLEPGDKVGVVFNPSFSGASVLWLCESDVG